MVTVETNMVYLVSTATEIFRRRRASPLEILLPIKQRPDNLAGSEALLVLFLRNAHEIRPVNSNSSKSKESTMKHMLILAAAIIIPLSSQVVARLGNTEDQVNALLGKPTDPGKPDSDGITTNMWKKPNGRIHCCGTVSKRS